MNFVVMLHAYHANRSLLSRSNMNLLIEKEIAAAEQELERTTDLTERAHVMVYLGACYLAAQQIGIARTYYQNAYLACSDDEEVLVALCYFELTYGGRYELVVRLLSQKVSRKLESNYNVHRIYAILGSSELLCGNQKGWDHLQTAYGPTFHELVVTPDLSCLVNIFRARPDLALHPCLSILTNLISGFKRVDPEALKEIKCFVDPHSSG